MASRRSPQGPGPADRGRGTRSYDTDPFGQTSLPLNDVFALAWTGDPPGVRGSRDEDDDLPTTSPSDLALPSAWGDEAWDGDRWVVPGQGELPLDVSAEGGQPGEPAGTPVGSAAGEEGPRPRATDGAGRSETSERTGVSAESDRSEESGESAGDGHGRAGRDLRAAIGVGVFLAGLVLVTLLTYKPAFVVLVTAAIVLGTREVVGALRAGGAEPPLVPVAAASGGLVVAAWLGGAQALSTGLLLAVLALAAVVVARDPRTLRRDLPAATFAVAYVGFLAGFAMLLLRPDDGVLRVITFIAVTVCSDIGGYATGVLSGGRHKLAPGISPGKSWEGLAGSLVACGTAGALFVWLGLDGAAWQGALVGLAVAVAATVGDLGESMLKRDVGIKDMGTLLPGHGGLMDRLDSLLVVAPVAWAMLTLVAPPG